MTSNASFDPIAYLNEPRWRDSVYGLDRIRALMEKLGNPQKTLKFVHVAGTNGKGSTCAYMSNILQCAGYKTGMFTSPYVLNFEERIQVDGASISLEVLRRITLQVRAAAEEVESECGTHPTEFELMCALALLHFAKEGCDVVVLEVGLGGTYDATNVIDAPLVCVITRIGLDHTHLLGKSLEQVAREKAGIIKVGASVVKSDDTPEVMRVIRGACDKLGCDLVVPERAEVGRVCFECAELSRAELERAEVGRVDLSHIPATRTFTYANKTYKTQLIAKYMPENAACAIEATRALNKRGFKISEDAFKRGIGQTYWPARFEIASRNPTIIIDAAHNPQGAAALADTLQDVFPSKRFIFVMSVMEDKDYVGMIRAVHDIASAFITFAPEVPRALDAAALASAVQGVSCSLCDSPEAAAGTAHACTAVPVCAVSSAAQAISRARAFAGSGDVIVAFGSLYSVAQLFEAVRDLANNA